MAKLQGVLKLEGSLDGLSFYKTKFGYVVRRKGGFDSKRLKKDKVYQRSRETASEFGQCSRAGKLLRHAFRQCTLQTGDQLRVSRLNSLLLKLKDLDTVSARGKRSIEQGLQVPEGKKLLKGFNFNEEAPVSRLLKKPMKVLEKKQEIKINELVCKKDLVYPKAASHVRLMAGVARIDFKRLASEVGVMNEITLPLDTKSRDVVLSLPEALKTKTGYDVYFIGISFLQEISGELLELRNEKFMGGGVVEVVG